MILKETWINLADNSSILWIRVFHLYGGFFRRFSTAGYYVKGSIRVLKRQRRFFKGFRQKLFKKGSVRRIFLIRTVRLKVSKSTVTVSFIENAGSLIKKKNVFLSKHSLGPVVLGMRNKRLFSTFPVFC